MNLRIRSQPIAVAVAAVAAIAALGVAPKPAEARGHVFVGGFFGVPTFAYPGPYYAPYYYPPAYYYPPPAYYYPPAYSYYPAPTAPSYQAPSYQAPPPGAVPPATGAPTPLTSSGDCRQFQTTVQVDGVAQPSTGTACLQADGSWKLVN